MNLSLSQQTPKFTKAQKSKHITFYYYTKNVSAINMTLFYLKQHYLFTDALINVAFDVGINEINIFFGRL